MTGKTCRLSNNCQIIQRVTSDSDAASDAASDSDSDAASDADSDAASYADSYADNALGSHTCTHRERIG